MPIQNSAWGDKLRVCALLWPINAYWRALCYKLEEKTGACWKIIYMMLQNRVIVFITYLEMWSLSSSYNLCRTQQKTVFDRKFFTVKRFEMPTYDRSMIWSHSSIAPKSNSIENSIGTSFTIIQTVFIQGFLARWLFGQNTSRILKTLKLFMKEI